MFARGVTHVGGNAMGGFGMVKVMTGLVVSTDTMQARQTKSGKRAMRAVAVAATAATCLPVCGDRQSQCCTTPTPLAPAPQDLSRVYPWSLISPRRRARAPTDPASGGSQRRERMHENPVFSGPRPRVRRKSSRPRAHSFGRFEIPRVDCKIASSGVGAGCLHACNLSAHTL